MQRLLGTLPNVISAVWLVAVDGRWTAIESFGGFDVTWALSVLGKAEHLELVTSTADALHVVVADRRRALLLGLPRDADVSAALAHARGVVRTEVS